MDQKRIRELEYKINTDYENTTGVVVLKEGQLAYEKYFKGCTRESQVTGRLSSLAQDVSRSISENCTWGICRRFEAGKYQMSTKRFSGCDADESGKLVINRKQEPLVVRLYQEFLDGKTADYITCNTAQRWRLAD